MNNSPRLPTTCLLLAVGLIAAVFVNHKLLGDGIWLSEVEIGAVAVALTLGIFGIQGLTSVLLEGVELRPGRYAPRLTNPLSLAIVLLSIILLATSGVLVYALTSDWSPSWVGAIAGAAMIDLSLLLVIYKEAFVGDEVSFDDRVDGVPW